MTLCATSGLQRRDCTCPSCVGRRNRARGLRAQREAKRLLSVPPVTPWGTASDEELWQTSARVEVKAGAQVAGVGTAYWGARAQADDDERPFMLVARPIARIPGRAVPLIVITYGDLLRVAEAVLGGEEENRL